jgi:hypothetical protein
MTDLTKYGLHPAIHRVPSTSPTLTRRFILLGGRRLDFRGGIAIKQNAVRAQIADQSVQVVG